MKKLSFAFLLLALGSGLQLRAQEKTPRPDYLEMYVSGGSNTYAAPDILLNDARLLVPNSKLLAGDLSRFGKSFSYYGYSGPYSYRMGGMGYSSNHNASMAGYNVEVQLGKYSLFEHDDARRHIQTRMGIGFGSVQSASNSWYYDTRTPYDTLVSSKDGSKAYVDSIYTEVLTVNYTSNMIRGNIDWLFHTNPDRRFSVYAGLGINAGMTYNNQTEVSYTTGSYLGSNNSADLSYYKRGESKTQSEWSNNKSGWMLGGYVPLGFSLRLGKTKAVLNQISLYMEMRTGISAYAIPELKTYLMPNFQSNFGMRIRF